MAFYHVVGFFCLFGGCCASVVNDDCPFVFNVERTIKNQGFHRNVDYYFELISVSEMSECHVCVKQAIPLGLYVNKDQITEMVRLGKVMLKLPCNFTSNEIPSDLCHILDLTASKFR
uniref:Phosphatidylinositol-glycan biosynthesis class X protein n=1 Tax=Lygus hesperus TaxID=30085 RepID=A0A0A9Y993_LYGHE